MSRVQTDLNTRTDEQLCALVRAGNAEAEELLVTRYTRLVRICARPLFLAGGDSEDLLQEGMFGVLTAIRSFDPDRQTQFHTFAEICIRTKLISAVRKAASGRHTPLNDSVSLEHPQFREDGLPAHVAPDPESALISREDWSERLGTLTGCLTGFETTVLQLYLGGYSYSEIAQQTGRQTKAVDNAVQRIRRKVARQLTSGDISKG